MARKRKLVPGFSEGHPDDMSGPTWDTVRQSLQGVLKEASECGLSMVVGLCQPSGMGFLGVKHPGKWYTDSVGDYMALLGLASYLEGMTKDEAAEAACVAAEDDNDEEEGYEEDDGSGRPV